MKKNVFLFKNCIFYRVFLFLIDKVLLIGAVDFDDLTVFLPSHCQVTFFPRLCKFVVSIAK